MHLDLLESARGVERVAFSLSLHCLPVAGHLLEQDVFLYSIVFGVPLYNLPRCRDPIEKTAGIDDCTMRPWLIRDALMVVFPVPKVAWWRYDLWWRYPKHS